MASSIVPLRNDEIFGAIVVQYILTISPFICGVHTVGLTNKRSDCQETAFIIFFRSKCLSYPGSTDIRIQSGHKSEPFTLGSFHIISRSPDLPTFPSKLVGFLPPQGQRLRLGSGVAEKLIQLVSCKDKP